MEVNARVPPLDGCRQWAVDVIESSQVAEARRRAVDMAQRLGFDETLAGQVALLVTEAGMNLVKHARNGQLLVRGIDASGTPEIEVLALDEGPGIRDVQAAFRDGYSTSGTPGTGLGAIRRLSTAFDLHSLSGRGTAVLARCGRSPSPHAGPRPVVETGSVCLPLRGQDVSGDAWDVLRSDTGARILVADGLGHGPLAAEAAEKAVAVFRQEPEAPLVALLQYMHRALRDTRGAVAAVGEMDVSRRQIRFAGVGNIAGVVCSSEESHNMVCLSGTLGHSVPTLREFTYPWPEDAVAVIHSDGVAARWSLADYPGLVQRDPAVIAGVLYRDFSRGRDDVTVVAARARALP